MPQTRGLVFARARQVAIEEWDLPDPGPGEVLVRSRCSLISTGTELSAFGGDVRPGSRWAQYVRYPWRPGYSNVGTVAAVGPEVTGLEVGQRVVSHGGHASLVLQKAGLVQPVPDAVSDEDATFCTLGVISLNGVRLARLQVGESVVVCGAGLVGVLATRFARMNGAWPVISLDLAAGRLEFAKAQGATHTLALDAAQAEADVRAITKGRMADAVFEVTGSAKVIPPLMRLPRRLGRVILLGSPRGVTEIDFHDEVHTNGLHVIGAHNSTHTPVETPYNVWTLERDRELFLDLVAAGEVQVSGLITHRFTGDEGPRAFEALWEDRTRLMGAVLDWTT